MLKDLNPTTRMYPRRMDEAFHDGVEQAKWFYPPERKVRLSSIIVGVAGVCMWVAAIVLMLK